MEQIFSLILPAYNVEEYIEECVESCENQDLTHDRYELIIVNDGSTDRTPEIIRSLAARYSNIHVINQENKGLSMARNVAIPLARGKYIWFIDTDDTITTNCLATLADIMDRLKLEILTFSNKSKYCDRLPEGFPIEGDISPIYDGVSFLQYQNIFNEASWSCIINQEFWKNNGFQFHPGICFEDSELMPLVYSKACRIAIIIRKIFYNYRTRNGSIIQSDFTIKKLLSIATIINSMISYHNNSDNPLLRKFFLEKATAYFIKGVNSIMIMNHDSDQILTVFLAKIHHRPIYIYAKSPLKRIYQYIILHYPRQYFNGIRILSKIRKLSYT